MSSFTDVFIKRPVLAMVVSFVILIAGSKALLPILVPSLQGLGGLNVRQYPRSDIASITVTTVYVGADAELIRGFITTPLERGSQPPMESTTFNHKVSRVFRPSPFASN